MIRGKLGLVQFKNRHTIWSEAEKKILIEKYGVLKRGALVELLNRSSDSIKHKAFELGLMSPNKGKEWTEEEIEVLKANYKKTLFTDLLKLLPERTEESIRMQCKRLGLRKTKKRKYSDKQNM